MPSLRETSRRSWSYSLICIAALLITRVLMVRPDPVFTKSFFSICAINNIYGCAALAARGVHRGGENPQREPRRRRALRHAACPDGAPPAAGGRARCKALRAHSARHEAHGGRRGLPPARRQGARQPRGRAAHRELLRARRGRTARAGRGAGGLHLRSSGDPQALLRRLPARERQREDGPLGGDPRARPAGKRRPRARAGAPPPRHRDYAALRGPADPGCRTGTPPGVPRNDPAWTRSPGSSSSSSTAPRATRSSRTRSSAARASSRRA